MFVILTTTYFIGYANDKTILGPLLFNIFICEMFVILKTTYFTGYADDKTPFVVRDNVTDMIKAP